MSQIAVQRYYCLDCGKRVSTYGVRCGSCANKKKWRDGVFARVGTYRGGPKRQNPPEAIKRFEVLVMAVIALEIVALLWVTGAIGGPL